MFSTVLNAQNKPKDYTPITSVTWSISSNTTSNYTGSQQTVTVVSVVPSNASYYVNTTGATNVGDVAQSTLYAANSYSGGPFLSPTLTIIPTGSISDDAVDATHHTLVATLTGATATNYSWSKVSGTANVSFSPNNSVGAQTTTITATTTNTSCTIQCVISYSSGSITVTTPINFGPV
jgi:hypothetical protein